MKLREVLKEEKKISDANKLTNFIRDVSIGNVGESSLRGAGFNLKNPSDNKEERIVQTLSSYLDIDVTNIDLSRALKKNGFSDVSDLVKKTQQEM